MARQLRFSKPTNNASSSALFLTISKALLSENIRKSSERLVLLAKTRQKVSN